MVMDFFFFSSRRRHTRYWRDWSSDVCSSDLGTAEERPPRRPRLDVRDGARQRRPPGPCAAGPRRGTGQIGRASCRGKSVDLGGRRIIKKNKIKNTEDTVA